MDAAEAQEEKPNFIYSFRPQSQDEDAYWLVDKTSKVEADHHGFQLMSRVSTPDMNNGGQEWRVWDHFENEWKSAPSIKVSPVGCGVSL
jgi:hypothetical protein